MVRPGEVCLLVVGYADGAEPFRMLTRVSIDVGLHKVPEPTLTNAEMEPVAYAAKMALVKVLRQRKSNGEGGK